MADWAHMRCINNDCTHEPKDYAPNTHEPAELAYMAKQRTYLLSIYHLLMAAGHEVELKIGDVPVPWKFLTRHSECALRVTGRGSYGKTFRPLAGDAS